jgi:hypothetical protein
MLKYLLKGIVSAIAVKLLVNYRHLSVHLLNVEATKSYIHGVRLARQSLIGIVLMGLVVGIILMGAMLFHAGLFFLLPGSVKVKAAICMLLGLAYAVAGVLALRAAADERTWMEKSGATKMLEDATRPSVSE